MEEFLKKNPKIKLTDFTTIEKSFKFSLRFELGNEIPNGTKKRIRQAKRRALKIFEEWFKTENELFVITYEWESEMFARTPDYIFKILNEKRPTKIEKLALMYFENEKIEYANGIIGKFQLKKGTVNWGKIFKAIGNTEMGFNPTCHQVVFIFGKESNRLFWMYDDMGCLIMSNELNELKNPYKEFNNWLVERYKEEYKILK